jgi:hypothetical protein
LSAAPPFHTAQPAVELVEPRDNQVVTEPELPLAFALFNQPPAARGLCVRVSGGRCQVRAHSLVFFVCASARALFFFFL